MALPIGLVRDPLNQALVKQLEMLEGYDFWEVDTVMMRKYLWNEEKINSWNMKLDNIWPYLS
jgi:hypothetical protein